ncbi:MAG: 23S rRNA (pseudouridine(1915)-N(3))-methyltransferase RlmH [Oscillospiraceae bacterium]|nr:23S rRNA (pseudouridine(1915)-N(3))-methyltransferase RlmH [Oscillospiraceae bacterium]
MLIIHLITVGKQKEPHLIQAQELYSKRLTPFCKFQFIQLPAVRLSDNPSEKEIQKALSQEAELVRKHLNGLFIPLCIEGRQLDSQKFSELLTRKIPMQDSAVSFVIGSSFGLDQNLKNSAFLKLSMSEMTFPHALASVMLMEQIYRAFQIDKNTGYHK